MPHAHRRHRLWYAFALHRASGLLLALFLPFHFYVLGLALESAPAMNRFLDMSAHPLLKTAEAVLIFLLAVHFFGGLRILALELLPWRDGQKALAAAAAAASFAIACIFLLNAV